MTPSITYETPRHPAFSDCYFYHSIDLPDQPNHPAVIGDWDQRSNFHDYTCHVDFTGKTFLDIGTASGFNTFEAEHAGAASVTSLDLPAGAPVNVIPWVENTGQDFQQLVDTRLDRIKNGYWYCWNALQSKARVLYRSIYDLDASLGTFDIVMVGCVLLHLRDPLDALAKIAARSTSTLIITEMDPGDGPNPVLLPNLLATGQRDPTDLFSWWQFPPDSLTRFLNVVGFRTINITRLSVPSPVMGHTGKFYSLVATRTP